MDNVENAKKVNKEKEIEIEIEIEKGRVLAKQITEAAAVLGKIEKAIKKVLQNIYDLIKAYAGYLLEMMGTNKEVGQFVTEKVLEMMGTNKEVDTASLSDEAKKDAFTKMMLLDNLMPEDTQKAGQCGQVLRSIVNLEAVKKEGNIREKITLIYNFRKSCALLWDVIHLYHTDNEKWSDTFGKIMDVRSFEYLMDNMSAKLGMPMRDAVKVCHDWVVQNGESTTCKNKPTTVASLCNLVFTPVAGQVLTTRMCPDAECRASVHCQQKGNLKVENVVPLLSVREIEFINKKSPSEKNANFTNKDTIIEWTSGRVCCLPIEDSIYYQFYEMYNKTMITGPSGTTDMLMTVINYFPISIYEKQLISLGLIVWMVVPPDHSVFEILSVLPPHGVVDYEPQEDEYTYVEDMVAHLEGNNYAFSRLRPNPLLLQRVNSSSSTLSSSSEQTSFGVEGGGRKKKEKKSHVNKNGSTRRAT